MKFHFAPVQGHTDAAYRHFHAAGYDTADITYYTPFIRWEKDGVRKRDLQEAFSPLNDGLNVVPQVIFRNSQELTALVSVLRDNGARVIDINMGCPFPLQTAKGRGAAVIASPQAVQAVREVVLANPDIAFSVKMRLGLSDPDEWREALPVLNELPLTHITLHPRVARQQYGGEVDLDQFTAFMDMCKVPVVYNGDLRTPDDIAAIVERFPNLAGIMLGRGILGRPSLVSEYRQGEVWSEEQRLKAMKQFHRNLYSHYASTLVGGDHQVLSKIQPFWEYAESEIGRKAWKTIHKASNIAKYNSALSLF